MAHLFETQLLGDKVPPKNRIVMPPITRTRASNGDLPTDGDKELIATHYSQRAGAGLIIAEATDVDQSSHGYARTPGIECQV
jgi:N-ethylmaleimide reductase